MFGDDNWGSTQPWSVEQFKRFEKVGDKKLRICLKEGMQTTTLADKKCRTLEFIDNVDMNRFHQWSIGSLSSQSINGQDDDTASIRSVDTSASGASFCSSASNPQSSAQAIRNVHKHTGDAVRAVQGHEASLRRAHERAADMIDLKRQTFERNEALLHEQKMAAKRTETDRKVRERQVLRENARTFAAAKDRLAEEQWENYLDHALEQLNAKEERIIKEMAANQDMHTENLQKYSAEAHKQTVQAYRQFATQKAEELAKLKADAVSMLEESNAPRVGDYAPPAANMMGDYLSGFGLLPRTNTDGN